MSVIPFILAAGSLPSLIFGAPVPVFPSRDVNLDDVAPVASVQSFQKRSYTVFGGDGLVSDGWPSVEEWVSSFDDMFEANMDIISNSCSSWSVADNSDDETTDLSNAIQSLSSSSGVDARFILAIVLQESNGCVRAPTTNYGVVNPGLMQSHDGSGTCNGGTVLNPCPSSEITQMISDGVDGTSTGDGLKALIAQAEAAGSSDTTQYYVAARLYNSGSVASDGNLGQGGATHCYVSDIANRLTGWVSGESGCDADTIGEITGTSSSPSSVSSTSTTSSTVAPTTSAITTTTTTPVSEPTTTVAPIPTTLATSTTTVPIETVAPTTTAAPTTTTTATPVIAAVTSSTTESTASSSSSAPVYPGAISTCQKYDTIVSGDYCIKVEQEVGITASQLLDWNSGLDVACTNLWLGYQYCIQA